MAGYTVVFDVGREWPSLWGLGAALWLVMGGSILWLTARDTFVRRRGPGSAEERKVFVGVIVLSGVFIGLALSVSSIADWWTVRNALRDGAWATVEGRVHGYDATPWRGHEPRFAVGPVRLEVPSSLTQKGVGSAIRDGAVVRVTYVDPPLAQPSPGPTVLRIELRD